MPTLSALPTWYSVGTAPSHSAQLVRCYLAPYPPYNTNRRFDHGLIERESRGGQRLASTDPKKASSVWLNSAGSSRLIACPVFGNMASPDGAIFFFKNRLGSMQASSSSPTTIRVGTASRR